MDEHPGALFGVITDIARFKEYVPGVQDSKITSEERSGDEITLVGSVKISVRYFSGWTNARVQGNARTNTISIEMVKGPFQLARARMTLSDGEKKDTTHAKIDVDYITPVAVYRSLIDRHSDRAFTQLMGLFAHRCRVLMSIAQQ